MTTPTQAELEQACSAVLSGAISDWFNGPTGVTKDEALDYAAILAQYVRGLIERREAP